MRKLMTCLYWMSRMISYFSDQGVTNQHGQGGGLFVEDDVVMGWLLGK